MGDTQSAAAGQQGPPQGGAGYQHGPFPTAAAAPPEQQQQQQQQQWPLPTRPPAGPPAVAALGAPAGPADLHPWLSGSTYVQHGDAPGAPLPGGEALYPAAAAAVGQLGAGAAAPGGHQASQLVPAVLGANAPQLPGSAPGYYVPQSMGSAPGHYAPQPPASAPGVHPAPASAVGWMFAQPPASAPGGYPTQPMAPGADGQQLQLQAAPPLPPTSDALALPKAGAALAGVSHLQRAANHRVLQLWREIDEGSSAVRKACILTGFGIIVFSVFSMVFGVSQPHEFLLAAWNILFGVVIVVIDGKPEWSKLLAYAQNRVFSEAAFLASYRGRGCFYLYVGLNNIFLLPQGSTMGVDVRGNDVSVWAIAFILMGVILVCCACAKFCQHAKRRSSAGDESFAGEKSTAGADPAAAPAAAPAAGPVAGGDAGNGVGPMYAAS